MFFVCGGGNATIAVQRNTKIREKGQRLDEMMFSVSLCAVREAVTAGPKGVNCRWLQRCKMRGKRGEISRFRIATGTRVKSRTRIFLSSSSSFSFWR